MSELLQMISNLSKGISFFKNVVNMDSLRFPFVNTWIIIKNVTSNYFNLVAQEKPLVFYCFSYVTEADL